MEGRWWGPKQSLDHSACQPEGKHRCQSGIDVVIPAAPSPPAFYSTPWVWGLSFSSMDVPSISELLFIRVCRLSPTVRWGDAGFPFLVSHLPFMEPEAMGEHRETICRVIAAIHMCCGSLFGW